MPEISDHHEHLKNKQLRTKKLLEAISKIIEPNISILQNIEQILDSIPSDLIGEFINHVYEQFEKLGKPWNMPRKIFDKIFNINDIEKCIEFCQVFIQHDSTQNYGFIIQSIRFHPKLAMLQEAIKLADLITSKVFDKSALCSDIREILIPAKRDIQEVFEESIGAGGLYNNIIDRVLANIGNNPDLLDNFGANILLLQDILPTEFMAKMSDAVFEAREVSLPGMSTEIVSDVYMHEASTMHRLYSISPVSLYALVNQDGFTTWNKDYEVKAKTLGFYRKVYAEMPGMLKILNRLQQNAPITNEEKEIFNKELFNNCGSLFYKTIDQALLNFNETGDTVGFEQIDGLMLEIPTDTLNIINSICKFYKESGLSLCNSSETLQEHNIYDHMQHESSRAQTLQELGKDIDNHGQNILKYKEYLEQVLTNSYSTAPHEQPGALHNITMGADNTHESADSQP